MSSQDCLSSPLLLLFKYKNMNNRLKKIFFLLGDILVLHSALALTLFIRYKLIDGITGITPYWRAHWFYFAGVFIIFLLVFYINNLYSLRQIASIRLFASNTVKSVVAASLLAIIYFYAYPRIDITPKTNLIIFALSSLILFLIWRRLAYWLISSSTWQSKLAIVGYDDRIEELIQELKNRPSLGYQTALIIKRAEDLSSLRERIKQENIRSLVLASEIGEDKEWRESLFQLLKYRLNFISYADFYEQVYAKIAIESIGQGWFLENLKEAHKNYFDFVKKVMDKSGALIMLLISLPFWPFIALAIKLSSRGPIFFSQKRLGCYGQTFKLYKFRSMRVDNNDGGMTIANDQRITRLGKFLRSSRLDEIPQLINIIKGEMSFIGPRPERPELAKDLERTIPFYSTRLLIKPGLTGWDQISGEYHSPTPADTMKKLQNDLYYIKHRSLYLDLSIILKTIATVLARRGR
jgi:exopolysaccharide biosynthesis polyprenyl glycosylphosphotransferase